MAQRAAGQGMPASFLPWAALSLGASRGPPSSEDVAIPAIGLPRSSLPPFLKQEQRPQTPDRVCHGGKRGSRGFQCERGARSMMAGNLEGVETWLGARS